MCWRIGRGYHMLARVMVWLEDQLDKPNYGRKPTQKNSCEFQQGHDPLCAEFAMYCSYLIIFKVFSLLLPIIFCSSSASFPLGLFLEQFSLNTYMQEIGKDFLKNVWNNSISRFFRKVVQFFYCTWVYVMNLAVDFRIVSMKEWTTTLK